MRLSRREILGAGAMLGVAHLLAGCAAPGKKAEAAGASEPLPGPVGQGNYPSTASVPPVRVEPTPSPVVTGAFQYRPRTAWTSAGIARAGNVNPMGGIARITVHHDGSNVFTSTSEADAAKRLESIRRSHLSRVSRHGEAWADIGYHYAIDPGGRVWEGRPIQYQGAHVEDQNEHNLGIVMLGNYEQQTPTRAQTAALDAFVAVQMRQYRVPVMKVYTHQEIGKTACPGTTLQRYMVAVRGPGGTLRSA